MLEKLDIYDSIKNRMRWLEISAHTHARNVAHSNVNGSKTNKVLPFSKYVLDPESDPILKTELLIKKEFETLDLTKISSEQSGLSEVFKNYFQMMHSSTTKLGA